MDNGDGTVSTVNRSKEGKRDRVVSTQGDDSWESFAILGRPLFLCIGSRGACEN